jgi:sugar lactone lactonase YvrE
MMLLLAAVVAVMALAVGLHSQGQGKSTYQLPNPYRTERDWGQLPAGMKWAAVIGAEPGPDGNIYVLHRCFENSCAGRSEPPLFKFDRSGKLLKAWGENMFVFPHGFFVDREGNVWASDSQSRDGKGQQVFKFDSNGTLLMTLGKAGVASADPGLFDEPTDVLVAPNGNIFVTEGHSGGTPGNDRVSVFDKSGKFIKSFGKKGTGPGEFRSPHTVAMDSQGNLFVGDRDNNRIQILDQDGKYLTEWKQFSRPSGIYITPDDTIYVADSESWGPDNPGYKKGIRIGSARTGRVDFFIEDLESTVIDHSGAEGVGVDAQGNVYGGVVRRRGLERHVKR